MYFNVSISPKFLTYLFMPIFFFIFIGCSRDSVSFLENKAVSQAYKISTPRNERNKYLAHVHQLTVEVSKSNIETAFQNTVTACNKDVKFQCTVLSSGIETGHPSQANIQIRIIPEGIDSILELASAQGKVINRSTDTEDLGDQIVDNKKRLEMLYQYRSRLEAIQQQPIKDVDSLIKIASELSSVQSNIEYAEGKKQKLLQRVTMDIVNIYFAYSHRKSVGEPISGAFGDFFHNLSEGISIAITLIAYLVPWVILILFILFGIKLVRVKRNRAK